MRPSLSVVVAVPKGAVESEAGLAAFRRELDASAGDELVVERGERGSVLVPRLWARGIGRSRGDVVALTLGSMVPDAGWAEAVRQTLGDGPAGVGGAIEPASRMRALDWAIHLCRYSSYLLPFDERDAEDLPGDNAAYRREAIEPLREVWASGFWETEVDEQLRGKGWRLRVTPRMTVRQGASVGFLAFCRNRFRHGLASGRHRARKFSAAGRIARALLFPAAALVMLARIRGNAKARGRAEGFRRGLPHLAVFLEVWAAGEAAGYLRGRS